MTPLFDVEKEAQQIFADEFRRKQIIELCRRCADEALDKMIYSMGKELAWYGTRCVFSKECDVLRKFIKQAESLKTRKGSEKENSK